MKKIQCKDHGEQEAILVDATLCRYKCKKCVKLKNEGEKHEKDRE